MAAFLYNKVMRKFVAFIALIVVFSFISCSSSVSDFAEKTEENLYSSFIKVDGSNVRTVVDILSSSNPINLKEYLDKSMENYNLNQDLDEVKEKLKDYDDALELLSMIEDWWDNLKDVLDSTNIIKPLNKRNEDNLKNAIASALGSKSQKKLLLSELEKPLNGEFNSRQKEAISLTTKLVDTLLSSAIKNNDNEKINTLLGGVSSSIQSIMVGNLDSLTQGDYLTLQLIFDLVNNTINSAFDFIKDTLETIQNVDKDTSAILQVILNVVDDAVNTITTIQNINCTTTLHLGDILSINGLITLLG